MYRLIVIGSAFLLLSSPASADKLACSVKASKSASSASLQGMAKVSKQAAQKTALAKVGGSSKQVTDGELEVEDGCLVYSFDIKIAGKSGAEEIMVDAGNGKILSHKHESAAKEAGEKMMDKMTP